MPSHRDLEGGDFTSIVETPAPRAAGIGDNSGQTGLLIGEDLLLRVKKTHFDVLKRAGDLITAADRIPKTPDGKGFLCADDATEKKMTEMVRQLSSCHGNLDTARTAEMAPYRENMNAIHGLFRDIMDKMVDPDKKTAVSLKSRLERALTAFKTKKLNEERERAAAEKKKADDAAAAAAAAAQAKADEAAALAAEAARKRNPEKKAEAQAAADAAAAQAQALAGAAESTAAVAAEVAETSVVDSRVVNSRSANALSGLQEFVDFKDLDRNKVDLEQLRQHIAADALEQAVRAYIRANNEALKQSTPKGDQPLKGVTFFINARTQVR